MRLLLNALCILYIISSPKAKTSQSDIIRKNCMKYSLFNLKSYNLKSNGTQIANFNTSSVNTCLAKCMDNANCNAVNAKDNKIGGKFQCHILHREINTAVYRELRTKQEENAGWIYYDTLPKKSKVGAKCQSLTVNPCAPCRCFDSCEHTIECVCDTGCKTPVGVRLESEVSNNQFSASSYYDTGNLPYFGRLHNYRAWCAKTNGRSVTEYLQIRFQKVWIVTAVATQGQPSYTNWVTQYFLTYSLDGTIYIRYEKTIIGNTDRDSVQYRELEPRLKAIMLRFNALEIGPQSNNPCFRVEVHGCPANNDMSLLK